MDAMQCLFIVLKAMYVLSKQILGPGIPGPHTALVIHLVQHVSLPSACKCQ